MSKDLLSSLFLIFERLMLTKGSDMCCWSMPGMAWRTSFGDASRRWKRYCSLAWWRRVSLAQGKEVRWRNFSKSARDSESVAVGSSLMIVAVMDGRYSWNAWNVRQVVHSESQLE